MTLTGGAGQLMLAQARRLRTAGQPVQIACQRGYFRFFMRSGWPIKKLTNGQVVALNEQPNTVVVDHGMELPGADVVFVHNLHGEANLFLRLDELKERIAQEIDFFSQLSPDTLIVANSRMVKEGLVRHFRVPEDQIVVHYPGYRSDRFCADLADKYRAAGREALKLDADTPLAGFVTSGDLYKRGLDVFLDAAEQILTTVPDARFLIVGAKKLPEWAAEHRLFSSGIAIYRPRGARPQPWMAALDVFLYPARYEEFGIVISEARALGVPIVTSRRVGATECLPKEYGDWLLTAPEPDALASRTATLLRDPTMRNQLAAAGQREIKTLDHHHYADATMATILRRQPEVVPG